MIQINPGNNGSRPLQNHLHMSLQNLDLLAWITWMSMTIFRTLEPRGNRVLELRVRVQRIEKNPRPVGRRRVFNSLPTTTHPLILRIHRPVYQSMNPQQYLPMLRLLILEILLEPHSLLHSGVPNSVDLKRFLYLLHRLALRLLESQADHELHQRGKLLHHLPYQLQDELRL